LFEATSDSADKSVWYVAVAMVAAIFIGSLFLVFSIEVAVPGTSRGANAVPPKEAATAGAPAADPKAATAASNAAALPPSESSRERIPRDTKARDAARAAGLLWAFACCAVGAFLGFIFGIPRSLSSDTARTTVPAPARPNETATSRAARSAAALAAADREKEGTGGNVAVPGEAAPAAGSATAATRAEPVHTRAPSTAVNTNLEQISDWLTKIIVGVSLVNSDRIGRAMLVVADEMASSFGGPGSRSLALAILTYFGVIGLLGGYLLTRLFLQRAFEALASQGLIERRSG
jgi:hypothetical protein